MNVLAAIDSDSVYDDVLETIKQLFNYETTSLRVQHYLRENQTGIDDHMLERNIGQWQRDFKGSVQADTVMLNRTEQVRFGDEIAHRLSEQSVDYDYIIVGTEQDSGLFRLLRGGTANKLVDISECPVVVVPADD